jgi:hypothetical protein
MAVRSIQDASTLDFCLVSAHVVWAINVAQGRSCFPTVSVTWSAARIPPLPIFATGNCEFVENTALRAHREYNR